MFWLILFLVAFAPAITAQRSGHPRAGMIIALDLVALGLLATLLWWGLSEPGQYTEQPLRITMLLAAGGAWLTGFLWSLGPSSRKA
jgi:hypothetical protein